VKTGVQPQQLNDGLTSASYLKQLLVALDHPLSSTRPPLEKKHLPSPLLVRSMQVNNERGKQRPVAQQCRFYAS
jgi:hypothetical protein